MRVSVRFSTSDYSPGISWPLRALRVAAAEPVAAVAAPASLPAAQAAAAVERPGSAQPVELAVRVPPTAWK